MKTIKILFVLLLAVSVGLGVSAFKQQRQPAATAVKFDNNWYEFTGVVTDLSQVQDANYYIYAGSRPECDDDTYICAVYAPGPTGSNQHPSVFSVPLKADLKDAFDNGAPTSTILMRN